MSRTITNRFGLPASLYNALSNDPYVGGGDISATRLIAPPRIVALRKKHEHEIVEDASDRIWSLLGQSAHLVAERAAAGLTHVTAEQRVSMPFDGILKPDGSPWKWDLSAQLDVLEKEDDGNTISDFKVTSVWSFLFGEKPEWNQQLNMQAMIHRYHGEQIHRIRIIAILRDWQKRKAQFEKDYPAVAVAVIPFPVWSYEEQLAFAQKRIEFHQTAQKEFKLSNYNPESLPICTPEERWYRGAMFQVKRVQSKSGKVNKKSDRNCKTKAEAELFIAHNQPPKGTEFLPVVETPGQSIRCLEYCDVAMFCPYGRGLKLANEAKLEQAAATMSPGELFGASEAADSEEVS